jgi:hypothetical protein
MAMTSLQRQTAVHDGVERAHSVRSPGHWAAPTDALIAGWHAANTKLADATSANQVFLAAVSRENCAVVLRNRAVKGPWNA